jgi:glucose-6-phosphate dehydrogenase assembly protein OpcA
MSTLWDTNAADIVAALSAERRMAGAVAFGVVLTLVVVVDERNAAAATEAAQIGAAAHPCRLLVVVRRQPDARDPRLDAEVQVGGRLGTGEAVTLRMYGRLARHAESVVLPLLAPDTPVVTWWYGAPPQRTGADPLGLLANRCITDTSSAPDPTAALRERLADYQSGDTDLSWTRLTHWRSALAAACDTLSSPVVSAAVGGQRDDPSVNLLAGWLGRRLAVPVLVDATHGPGLTHVQLTLDDGGTITVDRPDGQMARLTRTGEDDRVMPLPRRSIGELLAEELRRLGPDDAYRDALQAAVAAPSTGKGR